MGMGSGRPQHPGTFGAGHTKGREPLCGGMGSPGSWRWRGRPARVDEGGWARAGRAPPGGWGSSAVCGRKMAAPHRLRPALRRAGRTGPRAGVRGAWKGLAFCPPGSGSRAPSFCLGSVEGVAWVASTRSDRHITAYLTSPLNCSLDPPGSFGVVSGLNNLGVGLRPRITLVRPPSHPQVTVPCRHSGWKEGAAREEARMAKMSGSFFPAWPPIPVPLLACWVTLGK